MENYDFEAPRYVDFLQLAEADDGSDTDSWFDQHHEDDGFSIKRDFGHPSKTVEATKPVRVAVAQAPPTRTRAEDDTSRPTCPSPKKCAKLSTEATPARAVDSSTPAKNTRSQVGRLGKKTLSQSTGNLQGSGQKRASPGMRRQVTAKVSAQCSSTSNLSSAKTSEQLELERIANMRAEVAKTRRVAQESYLKNQCSTRPVPLRSNKPLTMPQGFHFTTDSRLKKKDGTTAASGQDAKDFASILRNSKTSVKSHPPQQTRPQPFKLSQPKASTKAVKYESDAEKIANFSKKTPQRYKSVPRNANAPSHPGSGDQSSRSRRHSPCLTVAQSPALACRGRSRPQHALSREQQEQLEWEKHQKEQFKAHPVNQKVLNVRNLGVPKVEPKPLTVPSEFALTRRRSMSTGDLREALNAVEEEHHHQFRARPANPRILKGPVGVKVAASIPLTVPESPAFALKNRVRPKKEIVIKEEPQHLARHNRLHVGVPFQPKVDHKFTVPEPFQVEERSKEMLTRRQQKIQQMLDEERKACEFQASELPSLSPDQLPPKQPRPATRPEPFDLTVDKRGRNYQDQFRAKQLEEEERLRREAVTFKAGPNTVIQKKAFQPQISTKPLTEIDEFHLNTDIRATRREQFDKHLKHQEAEIEAHKRLMAERMEREERAAVAKMRKEAVHRATDIKRYKTTIIKPSALPLTEAKSPKFSARFHTRRGSQ